jgi:hypothetical protein
MSEQNITTNELAGRLGKLEELLLQMKKSSELDSGSAPCPENANDARNDTSGIASRNDGFNVKNEIEFPPHVEDDDEDTDLASDEGITSGEVATFGIGVGVGAALIGSGLLLAKLFTKN